MLNYNLINSNLDKFAKTFASNQPYQHLIIDDFLLPEIAEVAFESFPKLLEMDTLKDFRQNKAQDPAINKFNPIFSEIILQHLHSPLFLNTISKITGVPTLVADRYLYAAGLAQGGNGSFLNVHIDNSSHPVTSYYRRLNLLIYLNKYWTEEKGGHLELWSSDLSKSVVISPLFNRMVIFKTDTKSWHSYRRVNTTDGDTRKSINIYYFTKQSPSSKNYYHVTSFRARHHEVLNKALYPFDNLLRTVARKFRKNKDDHAVLFNLNKK